MKTKYSDEFTYDQLIGYGNHLGFDMVLLDSPEMARLWFSDEDFPIDFIIEENVLLIRTVFVAEAPSTDDYAEFILRFKGKEGATKIKPNYENGKIWPMIWTSIGLTDLDPEELLEAIKGIYRTTKNFGDEALARFSLRKQFEE